MTQATKLAEGIFKSAQEAMDFGRGNVEALTQATQTYVAGTQDLSRQTLALLQSLSDQAMENARAFATVRSVKDAAELQANFARQTMERMMGETAKLQEAGFRLAEHLYLSGNLCVADTADWDPAKHTSVTAIAWAAHWYAAYTDWRIGGMWPTEGYRPNAST